MTPDGEKSKRPSFLDDEDDDGGWNGWWRRQRAAQFDLLISDDHESGGGGSSDLNEGYENQVQDSSVGGADRVDKTDENESAWTWRCYDCDYRRIMSERKRR